MKTVMFYFNHGSFTYDKKQKQSHFCSFSVGIKMVTRDDERTKLKEVCISVLFHARCGCKRLNGKKLF